MNRILFLTFAPVLLIGGAALHAADVPPPAGKPNIVMILADDLGRMDIGSFGAEHYKTPNIDRLAAEGILLTGFRANSPVCSPSRANLFTGQLAPHTGVYDVGFNETGPLKDRNALCPPNLGTLALCKPLFPESLQAGGYRTGFFGKWHLGDFGDYHPSHRGYDEAVVLLKPTSHGYFDFVTSPAVDHPKGQYLGDFLTDQAEAFINKHASDPRPFYLQLSHFLVHAPLQAPPEVVERFKKELAGVKGVNATYAAMVWCLDESVGRIMKALERNGVASTTLVVFTSDNGGVGGYKALGINGRANEFTRNLPYKGGKGQLYEGGVRVPFAARWPGVIPAGSVSDAPATMVDIYPTLLDLAGIPVPTKNKPSTDAHSKMLGSPEEFHLDGVSLMPLLRSGGSVPYPASDHYWLYPSYGSPKGGPDRMDWVCTPESSIVGPDGFKLIEFYHDGQHELYDMRTDPYEKSNLIKSQPEKAAELAERLHQWQKKSGARLSIPKTECHLESLDTPDQSIKTDLFAAPMTPALARMLYFPEDRGLYVVGDMGKNPPKSGIRVGMVLLSVGGEGMRTVADFHRVMAAVKPGEAVKITYWNDGGKKEAEINTALSDAGKSGKRKNNKESGSDEGEK